MYTDKSIIKVIIIIIIIIKFFVIWNVCGLWTITTQEIENSVS